MRRARVNHQETVPYCKGFLATCQMFLNRSTGAWRLLTRQVLPRAQKKLSVFPGWPLPLQSPATNTAIVVTAKAPFPPATAPQLGLSSCKGGTGSVHLTELADQGGLIPQWEGVTLALLYSNPSCSQPPSKALTLGVSGAALNGAGHQSPCSPHRGGEAILSHKLPTALPSVCLPGRKEGGKPIF